MTTQERAQKARLTLSRYMSLPKEAQRYIDGYVRGALENGNHTREPEPARQREKESA